MPESHLEHCAVCPNIVCISHRAYAIAKLVDSMSYRSCFFGTEARVLVDEILNSFRSNYGIHPEINQFSDNPYDSYYYYCFQYILCIFDEFSLPDFFIDIMNRMFNMAFEAVVRILNDNELSYTECVEDVRSTIALMIGHTSKDDFNPYPYINQESNDFLLFIIRHPALLDVLTPIVSNPGYVINLTSPCLRLSVISLTIIVIDWKLSTMSH
jgi:hypothetical protein